MRLIIIETTDGQFLGHEFDSADRPVCLCMDGSGRMFMPDEEPRVVGPRTWRFSNSNYVIDAQEL